MIPFPQISPEIFSIQLFGIELALRWYALAYLVGLLIGWRIWATAVEVASYGGTTPSLELPVAPVGFLAATLCAVSALLMLAQIFYRPAEEN